ncbi:MAG: replication endonuclease [Burkholderiaceae bacterium]|nr:replication endonuclease [Burkholderiaceae bacterium]
MNHEMAIRLRNDHIAAHPGLTGLPPRWRTGLVKRVITECKHFLARKIVDSIADRIINDFRSEHALRGLDLTASDAEIRDTARRRASNVGLLLSSVKEDQLAEEIIATTCGYANVETPKGDTMDAKKKRFSCAKWWSKQLRKIHARVNEVGNIKLRFVQAKCEPYASRDAVRRCVWQDERNRLWMENTKLQNENGDQFTMLELSERGTSDKAIRRAELMTRTRGMEDFARVNGYKALFVTITCPSYFHATLKKSGQANPQYRNKSPRQAQKHLSKVWSQIRAKYQREGIDVFGLRVAEPHHDACPHWHLIMFVKPERMLSAQNIISHYALLDSPEEPGAEKSRVKFKEIDSEKGSATGYVAKYISKNIDGYKLETDLTGELALTASVRVTAWAKTHGIRQFQDFGAGSVTVWRELRRIPLNALRDAPEHVKAAWHAANKEITSEGGEKRVNYAAFLSASGGAAMPRKHATIKLAKVHYDTPNRYGEPLGEKPVGIYSADAPKKVYESTRYTWTPVEGAAKNKKTIDSSGQAQAQAILKKSGFDSTWTRVNNCTGGIDDDSASIPFWMEKQFSKDTIFDRMRC